MVLRESTQNETRSEDRFKSDKSQLKSYPYQRLAALCFGRLRAAAVALRKNLIEYNSTLIGTLLFGENVVSLWVLYSTT